MAYVNPNFKTKKAFKESFKEGKQIEVFQPGPFTIPSSGTVCIEGPHYPAPHTWYAQVEYKNGIVTKIKG